MSLQLRVVRAAIHGLKLTLGRLAPNDERTKKGIKALPKAGGEETSIAGTRCVWVNQQATGPGVLVYLHGGSYTGGPAGVQWTWFQSLARETGLRGLLVDYGLAPQHPHPVGLDQAMGVLAALREQGIGPIVVAGDSAGGGLAAALGLRLRDEGLLQPAAFILVSPWVDITMTDPAGAAMDPGDAMLSVRSLDLAARHYAAGADRREPYLSPLFGDLTGLAPMHISVGTAEMFLPEDRAFAAKARTAGVDVELLEIPGGFHVTPVITFLPEAKAANAQTVTWLRSRL